MRISFGSKFLAVLALLFSACKVQNEVTTESPGAAEESITRTVWASEMLERVQVLSADSLEGREVGTNGSEKARRYLEKEFDRIGISTLEGQRFHKFELPSGVSGLNILGEIRSKTLSDSAKQVIIGAHYDHVGMKGQEIYNGADDNASGVSLMLAIADTLAAIDLLDARFIFIAFDAEESGLIGASKFVSENPMLIKETDLMINFDMVSVSSDNELYVSGLHHYPHLVPIVDGIETLAEFELKRGHDREDVQGMSDWTYASDHGPFHKAGVPFLYFGVEDHIHYHQPSDNFSIVDRNFYTSVGMALRGFVSNLETLL